MHRDMIVGRVDRMAKVGFLHYYLAYYFFIARSCKLSGVLLHWSADLSVCKGFSRFLFLYPYYIAVAI